MMVIFYRQILSFILHFKVIDPGLLGTQYRVVRLPCWLKVNAELNVLVVIFGYVRVFACARILMAAIEFDCILSVLCLPPCESAMYGV